MHPGYQIWKKIWGLLSEKNTFFHFLWTSSARLQLFFSGVQYINKCLPKTMIKKIISAWVCILEKKFTFFWQALSNFLRLFLAHFLSESNGILSQLSEMVQHLYFCWRNKGSRVPNIFNSFSIKIHVFLNHSKSDVFHPP